MIYCAGSDRGEGRHHRDSDKQGKHPMRDAGHDVRAEGLRGSVGSQGQTSGPANRRNLDAAEAVQIANVGDCLHPVSPSLKK